LTGLGFDVTQKALHYTMNWGRQWDDEKQCIWKITSTQPMSNSCTDMIFCWVWFTFQSRLIAAEPSYVSRVAAVDCNRNGILRKSLHVSVSDCRQRAELTPVQGCSCASYIDPKTFRRWNRRRWLFMSMLNLISSSLHRVLDCDKLQLRTSRACAKSNAPSNLTKTTW
jgi:hypothetical protein